MEPSIRHRAAPVALVLLLAVGVEARAGQAGTSTSTPVAPAPTPAPPARPPSGERGGSTFLTAEEAVALAFPGCEVQRETLYLTAEQEKRVELLAGTALDGAIARPWVARREGKIVGTAYIDTHKVRTLKETLFVVVDLEGRVARTEVLAFGEPREYLPRGSWYEAFRGRALDDELRVKRAIRPVTGASITVTATTDAVRRVLALHKVLGEPAPKR